MAYKKQVKTCKFCGQSGFHWTQTGQGWRLTDPQTGALHQCAITRTALLQKAIELGLSPTVGEGMRLRDLQTWVEQNQNTSIDPEDMVEVEPETETVTVEPVLEALKIAEKPVETKPELPEGIEHVHPNYYKALAYYRAVPSANQWWAGPAGSGKTTLASCIAKALGKELHVVAISKNTAEFDLLGYMDGHGRYVPGKLYEPLRGTEKFVLIDECDRGTDGVLVVMNSILDQRVVTFPNGEKVHIDPSILFAASGNTWGRGADAVYTAAGALDAAFLDRFQFKLSHDYDEQFELAITQNRKWTKFVQKVRKVVFDLRLQGVVLSPRASRDGGAAINAGIPWTVVEQDTLWSAIPVELQASIRERLGIAA